RLTKETFGAGRVSEVEKSVMGRSCSGFGSAEQRMTACADHAADHESLSRRLAYDSDVIR
ncbi:hypothetical protein J8J27_35145, partial [Mycobacterium tuberculosis]|nr:hypothetical protein [Mycobacterium tuberculosis]